MIKVEIPGRETLMIDHVVLDYNGTVAVDGILLEELKPRLQALLKEVSVTVLTADTYGTVRAQCEPLGLRVETFPREGAAKCKAEIVKTFPAAKPALETDLTTATCLTLQTFPWPFWKGKVFVPAFFLTPMCWSALRRRRWIFCLNPIVCALRCAHDYNKEY